MSEKCDRKFRIGNTWFPCGNPKRARGPECADHRSSDLAVKRKRAREEAKREKQLRAWRYRHAQESLHLATREQLREELRRREEKAARRG